MKSIGPAFIFTFLLAMVLDFWGTGLCAPDISGDQPKGGARDAQWEKYAGRAIEADNRCDFNSARNFWEQAIARSKSFADKDARLSQTLYYAAKFYARWGQYDRAITLMSRFVSIKRHYFDKEYLGLAWNLAELGDLYFDSRKWNSAISKYKEAIGLWQTYGRWPDLILTIDKLARANIKDENPTSAEDSYRKALEVSKQAIDMPGLAEHKYFVLIATARVLSDYSNLLAVDRRKSEIAQLTGRRKQIARQLSGVLSSIKATPALTSAAKSEVSENMSILGRLECYYAKRGLYADAENVEDIILEEMTAPLNAKRGEDQAGRKKALAQLSKLHLHCYGFMPSLVVPSWVSDVKLRAGPGNDAAASSLDNPYLQQFRAIKSRQEYFEKRLVFTKKYAWGIPNEAAIKAIKQYQPVVEVMAGTGYWAYLLRQLKTDIVSYERNPVETGRNSWYSHAKKSWSQLLTSDESAVSKYPSGRALLLCWPPGDLTSFNALARYKGDTVILVGEPSGPCSAPQLFHDQLKNQWQLEKQIDIPQWPGIYDSLFVFKKRRA